MSFAVVKSAIPKGDLAAVTSNLDALSDRECEKALQLAVEHNQMAIVAALAKAGVSLSTRYGKRRETLLHIAAARNLGDMAQFLLQRAGAAVLDEPTQRDGFDDMTPLHVAVTESAVGVVEVLLAADARTVVFTRAESARAPGVAPVHLAVEAGNDEILKMLLDHGCPPNLAQKLPGGDAGDTPMHTAARDGALSTVRVLLACGASAAIANADGDTALDVAKDRAVEQAIKTFKPDAPPPSLPSASAGSNIPKDESDFDLMFKIVLVGDSGVGKTNLLTRFYKNEYTTENKPTIGVEFLSKTFKIDRHFVRGQLWDTAGQERFRSLSRTYFKGAHGVLLVYDVNNRRSFERCEDWLSDIDQNMPAENCKIILVGNKCDLERAVPDDEAKAFAQRHGMGWLYTSAKTEVNVQRAFEMLIVAIYDANAQTMLEQKDRAHLGGGSKLVDIHGGSGGRGSGGGGGGGGDDDDDDEHADKPKESGCAC